MSDDLSLLDATAQAELVRNGSAHPTELIDAAIERIERVNPVLNAVIHERFERARAEAAGDLPDGPFRGVPFLLKDLDGYSAGDSYHAGSEHLKRAGYVATHDSYIVERFRAAGLVCVGKTNTPELGLVPSAEPAAYGPTRNPWDLERSAGGSSGGSAAAVAAGLVPVAHAGDGGGSIRIPASECGLVGLKPSRGRHSLGPELGEAWGGNVVRILLGRTVRDAATALDVMAGAYPGDPYMAPPPPRAYRDELGVAPGKLRIGFTTTSGDASVHTHEDCIEAVRATAALLEGLGHDVVEHTPAVWQDEQAANEFVGHFITAYGVWTARELDHLEAMTGTPVTPETVEPMTWAVAEAGRAATGVAYHAAIDAFHAYTRQMARFWSEDGFDLLLTPTIPEPPLVLGQFTSTAENPLGPLFRAAQVVPFVAPFNTTGQPAVSLPMHQSEQDLPIGVQLVAAYAREDLLVRIAAQLEEVVPWADRRPPTHA